MRSRSLVRCSWVLWPPTCCEDDPMRRSTQEPHGRLVTRRQLLGHGLVAGTAIAFSSSLGPFWSKRAMADVPRRIPFLAIDLAGGANIAGSNVMVGKKGGQQDFLSAYDQL